MIYPNSENYTLFIDYINNLINKYQFQFQIGGTIHTSIFIGVWCRALEPPADGLMMGVGKQAGDLVR